MSMARQIVAKVGPSPFARNNPFVLDVPYGKVLGAMIGGTIIFEMQPNWPTDRRTYCWYGEHDKIPDHAEFVHAATFANRYLYRHEA